MTKTFLSLLCAVAGNLFPYTTPSALSADIETVKGSDQCAIRIERRLDLGDADRFEGLVKSFEVSASESSEGIAPERAVCLNSPGGNYLEGRQIAQLVHDTGLTTRIEAGAECYSACALIFMAGRINGAESDTVSRYLHVDGRLGFHAPYFDLAKDETINGEQAMNLVRLSSAVIAEFVAFGSSRSIFDIKPMISASLLAEMLAAGPDEMSMVDTVEKVARWNIQVEGARTVSLVDRAGAVRACLNFQAWLGDEPSQIDSLSYYLSGREELVTLEFNGKREIFAKIQTGGMEDRHCLVSRDPEPVASLALCSSDDFNGTRIGDCAAGIAYYVPWYYAFDPATKLTALR